MRAADHTQAMLAAWLRAGVDRVDLAVRTPEGRMLWQQDRAVGNLPLAWLRGANAHGSEIYIRPARGFDWPLVFLDDVVVSVARETVARHGGLAVQTSTLGGCHLWLPLPRPLGEEDRCQVQRWLAGRLGADPASVSGEHLGRLAGFRNWKRGGAWVNVKEDAGGIREPLEVPQEVLAGPEAHPGPQGGSGSHPGRTSPGRDTTPSGRDWGWVCSRLEAGMDPEAVQQGLVAMARSRRGDDAERYARRTVARAMVKVGRSPG